MNNDSKRILICLPNQPHLYGLMTLEYAKMLVKEKSPNQDEIAFIIVMEHNKDVITCLVRNNDNWAETEIKEINFTTPDKI